MRKGFCWIKTACSGLHAKGKGKLQWPESSINNVLLKLWPGRRNEGNTRGQFGKFLWLGRFQRFPWQVLMLALGGWFIMLFSSCKRIVMHKMFCVALCSILFKSVNDLVYVEIVMKLEYTCLWNDTTELAWNPWC